MKLHPGTSFVSTVEILQPNTISFFWRILTIDEDIGRVHSIAESRERFTTFASAQAAGDLALSELEFA